MIDPKTRAAASLLFAFGLLAFAALTIPSCGTQGATDPPGSASVLRGILKLNTANPETAGSHSSARSAVLESVEIDGFEIGAELPPWSATSHGNEAQPVNLKLTRVREGSGKVPALNVQVIGRSTLRLPSPPPPTTYNRIVLRMSLGKRDIIWVGLEDPSGQLVESKVIASPKRNIVFEYAFDVSHFAQRAAPDSPLHICFRTEKVQPSFVSIRYLMVPLESYLPEIGGKPEMVRIAGDTWSASGLSSMHELISSFPAADHLKLHLAFGQPREVSRPNDECTLVLSLWRADEERENGTTHIYDLKLEDREVRWQSLTLPLQDYAGSAFHVAFSLTTSMPGMALCVVAQPRVIVGRRGSDAPTVLLVTSDTHRGDHLGIAGLGVDVSTPFLDKLAGQGLRFSDCYSSANVTVPSHVALMTGVTPRDHGVIDNAQRLGSAAATLAERFQEAGFITLAAVSLASLEDERCGLGQGFDRMSSPRRSRQDSQVTIHKLREMMGSVEGLPVFAWLHIFDAHTPYESRPKYTGRYYDPDKDPFDESLPPLSDKLAGRLKWTPGVRDLKYVEALYRGEVSYLDESLRTLIEDSRFERGILAITADHGELLGEGGSYFTHSGLSHGTLHVPLILNWPNGPVALVDKPVRQIDLGRTLLNLAGVSNLKFPGLDLSSDEMRAAAKPRFAIRSKGLDASVAHAGHLLVLSLTSSMAGQERELLRPKHGVVLYDLQKDRRCEYDLTRSQPGLAAKMRKLLITWLTEGGQQTWRDDSVEASAEALQDLAELGYSTATVELEENWLDAECSCEQCSKFE